MELRTPGGERDKFFRAIKKSSSYDKDITPEEYQDRVLRLHRGNEAKAVAALFSSDHNPANLPILDLAAGTGILSRALMEKGFPVTALDTSKELLAYLKEQSPQIPTVQADMNETLPFADNSFAGVTTLMANRYILHPSKFVSEIHRILKPGGSFIWPLFPRERRLWRKNIREEVKSLKPKGLLEIVQDQGFIAELRIGDYSTKAFRTNSSFPAIQATKKL